MFPVPYRKIRIVSPHSVDVVAERLQLHTSRRWPWFRSPAPQFDFVGSISPKTFRLVPSRRGRNTYTPWLRGRMTPLPDGTKIKLVQTLHPAGAVIIVGFVILALVLWSRTEYIGGAAIFTAGLFVLHGVMYCIAFLPQARRAEKRIRQLATKVESSQHSLSPVEVRELSNPATPPLPQMGSHLREATRLRPKQAAPYGRHDRPARAISRFSHDLSRVVQLRKNFTPGCYVLHCEMPITNTKLTHADVGMVRELEIKEQSGVFASVGADLLRLASEYDPCQ